MFRPRAMLFTVGLLAFGTNLRAADDQPKDVIARAIKAHGGEEMLTRNKAGTTKGKGKITIADLGEIYFTQETAHMLPDKFKESLETKIAGTNVRISTLTLIDGDKCVVTTNGKPVDLSNSMKTAIKEIGYKLKIGKLVPLIDEEGYELSLIGDDKVEDKPVVGIRVATKGHSDISLYFDKETDLLLKVESRTNDPSTGHEITEERIIAEYQKNQDGIPIPKKVILKHDSRTFLEIELSEVQFLEKIDDSEFKTP